MVVDYVLSLRGAYLAVFLSAAVGCLAGVAGTRTIDHPDVRRGLRSLLVLSGVWSLFTALQFAATDQSTVLLLNYGGLVVGITTVFAWLMFASAYAGYRYHRQQSLQAASVAVLGGILLVKLTNPLHERYFTIGFTTEPFVHWTAQYGMIHWFVTGFAYTAAAVGFFWLFASFERGDSRPLLLYALVFVTALPVVPALLSGSSELLLTISYEPLGVATFAVGTLFYARTEFANHSSPGQSVLADSLSAGGIVLDKSGVVIDSNAQAARILGHSTIPRVPLAEIDADLAALETGETTHWSETVDGSERTYEIERVAVTESHIAAEIVTLTDVTRTVRLEALAGLHREITDALVERTDPTELVRTIPDSVAEISAYDLVWLYPAGDTDEGPNAVRPSGRPNTDGTAAPGVVSGSATAYAAWASTADAADPVRKAAQTASERHTEITDATATWSRRAEKHGLTGCVAVPFRLPTGERYVLGVYTAAPGGFTDAETEVIGEISDRVPQAVEAIETREEALRYEEAITHAGVAISITDPDGTIQYVNPTFEELTGYDASEAMGSTHQILNSGEMSDTHYEQLWDTITAGDIFKDRVVNRSKDGDRYILQQTISPVTDEAGEPEAFVAIQFDITDKLLREQRLSVLNRVLRHNMRTSVNVIAGNTTVLEDRLRERHDTAELPDSIADPLATIRQRAAQINSQAEAAREIEEILAAEETGRSWVPIAAVVEAAVETATDLGGTCELAVGELLADQRVDTELIEIVEELVENAIRHHEASPEAVDLQLSVSQSGDDVLLRVVDDGPGLSDQELVVIEEGAEKPLRHGSGLGLWKINWLAISSGGSISATTGSDGTTIQVCVPLRGTDPTETDTGPDAVE